MFSVNACVLIINHLGLFEAMALTYSQATIGDFVKHFLVETSINE